MYHNIWKLTRTSDKLVVMCFDMYGSSNVSRSLDFVNSIKQSHCFSSSETFVALRIITFWHLICKKKTLSQTVKQLVYCFTFRYIQNRSWSKIIKKKKEKTFISFQFNVKLNFWWMTKKKRKQFSIMNFQRHTKGKVNLPWCSNSVMPSGNWAIWKVKDMMDQYKQSSYNCHRMVYCVMQAKFEKKHCNFYSFPNRTTTKRM